jgi:lipoyl(octanoyl) transferase
MSAAPQNTTVHAQTLQVYLLGSVEYEAFLRLQRRLQFDIAGDRTQAALIICEHPPLITVGRQGSRRHIRLENEELRLRRLGVRWVNRGGGCVLHGPGQLTMAPILPLDHFSCGVNEFLQRLGDTVRDLLADFSVPAEARAHDGGVWTGDRLLAALGVSVRDWISGYGAYINIHPALDLHRFVTTCETEQLPMTSLERERRGPVRPALVRERLIEHFRTRFGFARVALFSDHPVLHAPKPVAHASASAARG